MYVSDFAQKFSKIAPRKKAIIRDYCRLYEDTAIDVNERFDRIESIWTRAIGHSDLLVCLELADHIYAEVDDSEIDGDERARLCEHLFSEVGLKPDPSEYIPIDKAIYSSFGHIKKIYVLECPNGELITVQGYMSDDENDSHSLNNWVCSQCNEGIVSHKKTREGVTRNA